ncbi:MAG: hypothetical protein H6946_09880 [Thauera sp.]|uniref:hypothetical protein n=1 Tax=Thauera sp. TaxID=1905334 RepID=UPI00262C9412|nr:hypothetical protein [Thauera sp.]MCP5225414.1 hypothetical protein [Thauera sp.]
MRTPILPHLPSAPLVTVSRAAGGGFVQGFVAAGCVSAFQDHPAPACAVDLKRVLRHALQGGAALVATAAGAAGVLLIERLLRDSAKAVQERKDV